MARRKPAYARLPIIPEEEPEEALSALVSPTELSIPSQDPEEILRAASPEEELPGGGLSEVERPEGLGAYGEAGGQLTGGEGLEAANLDWTPVSDEQAQRWEEEKRIFDAPHKISLELRKSRDYRQELIDKHFDGIDPNVRDVKKHAALEISAAKKQFEEILGRTPNTPEERLAQFNFTEKARKETYSRKQEDIDTLNKAISTYTTEQTVPMISFIQREVKQLQEKHAAQAEAGLDLGQRSVAMKRLFDMRKAIEKLDEAPPQEMIDAYNTLATQLGQQPIDVEQEEEAEGTWWKPWTWGSEKEEMTGKVTKPIRRKWDPNTGRLES